MRHIPTLTLALLLAAAQPVLAQSTIPSPGTAPAAPAAAPAAPTGNPPGVSATVGNPNLAVASIKLDHGTRVSKILGATVYGTDSKDLGKIDDLVMTGDNQVTLAVVSVGGFLGVGSKLVAFPFKNLKQDGDRLTLPGVTADTLNTMPSFEY